MKKVDSEDRPSVRSALAKECGFTGLSILHRLNCLYGFNVLLDQFMMPLHNISLNVISHHLHYDLNEAVSRLEKRCSGLQVTICAYYTYETPCRTQVRKDSRRSYKTTWLLERGRISYSASECVFGGILPDEVFGSQLCALLSWCSTQDAVDVIMRKLSY